jgi:hypothetical protein
MARYHDLTMEYESGFTCTTSKLNPPTPTHTHTDTFPLLLLHHAVAQSVAKDTSINAKKDCSLTKIKKCLLTSEGTTN